MAQRDSTTTPVAGHGIHIHTTLLKKGDGTPVSLRRLKDDLDNARPHTSSSSMRPTLAPSLSSRAGPETSSISAAAAILEPLERRPKSSATSSSGDLRRLSTHAHASLVSRQPSQQLLSQHPSDLHHHQPFFQIKTSSSVHRCFGCGGSPEMCLTCFSECKKSDMTKYKQSLAKGVEWLFAKATTRAFHHMSITMSRMIFGVWKFYVQHKRHHRAYVVRFQTRVRVKRLFLGWRMLTYERRTYGAMLYAAEKQKRVETLELETDQLHGTVTELTKHSHVRSQLDDEKVAKLHATIEVERQRVAEKNKELAAVKMQLTAALATIEDLRSKAKASEALAPLEAELFDYKKACFQMANEMLTQMERQLEDYSLFEGQQNLADILSGDVVNSLDFAEHPLLYDPTAKFAKENKLTDKTTKAPSPKKSKTDSPGTMSVATIDRADRILMQWANAMVRKSSLDWIKPSRINNCNTNLQDGKSYAVLTLTLHDAMCKMKSRKKDFSMNPLQRENGMALTDQAAERYVALMTHEVDDQRRIDFMMNTIGQAMWLPSEFVQADDILAGDTDFNLVFLGYLFCTSSPNLDDAHHQHVTDTSRDLTFERAKWRELKDAADATTKDQTVSKKIKLALAHLFELKKKLDGDTRKAHDGHVLWWKSARIVLRKCFLTLSLLAHGKSGFMCSADKSAENEGFLVVPREKLKSVLFANEDSKWELDMLQGYLNSVFNDLARIYRGYASRSTNADDDVAVMSQGDLLELLSECNVPDANFALADMADILVDVTQTKSAAENGVVDVNRALLPVEFIEALIRIARKRYSGVTKKTALSESFCLLVDNQILPFAYQSDADKFRKQMESPGIRSLMIKYLDDLKTLFGKYSFIDANGGGNKKMRKQLRMTGHSLVKFVADKSIEDVAFTNDRVMQVVGHVCQGRTLSKTELMQRDVTFEAFQEAMVAMACHKFPDPYLSVENRFEKFANLYIVTMRDGYAV
ncbi:hypothetical protein H257_11821 [Aphanomyces astaci]|uniref:Calponin-homology (CH) domain-containing protein n=3 Tax=Aphanomyces astaci TaxID=112090 RepID=W4G2W0_APHAT|nr:hypothetical protein H257_11821 [Aphanomyces astaci]ETV73283.1 hypothetical protein H257_11821 [Aphanomyces astaci]|eukprot:XP_009837158.1 hypothetical protein H257_11821 [Aphanomyces astaci]